MERKRIAWSRYHGSGNRPQNTKHDLCRDRHRGIFKSTDGGGTWIRVNTGLPPEAQAYILKIDPIQPDTLYTEAVGYINPSTTSLITLFKSTDGGKHWRAVNASVDGTSISLLTVSASGSLYALILSASGNLYTSLYPLGISKSTDGGATWRALGASPIATTIAQVAIDPLSPTTLYAAAEYGEIFKSMDSGVTWRALNTSVAMEQVNRIVIDPTNPTTLYAATQGGLFKSTDGGETWSNDLKHYGFNTVMIDPVTPSTIYAIPYMGPIFKSVDTGKNWSPLTATPQLGQDPAFVFTLAIDPTMPTTLYAGTIYGLYKSTDGGVSWNGINSGFKAGMTHYGIFLLGMDQITPTTLYAGLDNDLYKSTDGGENWSVITTSGLPSNSRIFRIIDPTNSSTLYAEMKEGLFESRDGGANWYPLNTGLPGTNIALLAIDPSMPNKLYLGASGHGLFSLVLTK